MNKIIKDYIIRGYGFLHHYFNFFYNYRHQKYGRFPAKKEALIKSKIVEPVIYCFWTGDNEMSEKRKKNLNETIKNVGVKVCIITPNNLSKYIKKEYPLHPAYDYLSNVHKSDYLRCYFMHHWGGGYLDIKKQNNSWASAFKKLNRNQDKIAAGYREFYWGMCKVENGDENAHLGALNNDLRLHYAYLLGNCAFIFKPYTNFTEDWIAELNHRLDENFEKLKENPGNILGDNEGYPLPWTYILGQIYHPLCLKYHKNLIIDNNLKPEITDYR